ncbi:Postreplication repair E3 ubiquitin-protein ligase rad18 [Dissostichus eleginoides]|uniref:Postreplication repair E3 ubiquitin-protein ligase rad18 n=1 Tax=Dissostichus eleginoides TaxID=100907 RepID=A0AAD9EQV0_DISEL|nr:Postreplication repair E3 ubiquitin-protein ligase rad18 [Dissostichus eleginoides]
MRQRGWQVPDSREERPMLLQRLEAARKWTRLRRRERGDNNETRVREDRHRIGGADEGLAPSMREQDTALKRRRVVSHQLLGVRIGAAQSAVLQGGPLRTELLQRLQKHGADDQRGLQFSGPDAPLRGSAVSLDFLSATLSSGRKSSPERDIRMKTDDKTPSRQVQSVPVKTSI